MRDGPSDASAVRPRSSRRAPGNGRPAPRPAMAPAKTPLLMSKLAVAAVPDAFVERPRLGERLDAGVRGAVTLLSAPAGWGKTTLLGSWVRTGRPAYPVGWLTLEADDTGDRFWAYLEAALAMALETADERRGDGRWAPPDHPGALADETFLARLAAALTGLTDPVVLVLDDFDRVHDASVPAGLEFLVRHAAARLRLVIATRTDPPLPLPRWRLTGELTELRAPELAFLRCETAELLERHDLLPTDADVRALHARTEGWAAALRLAALSLRGHPEPARFVAEFGGDDRQVADYLAGEILGDQPAEVRETLLCTSVLQRVCGPLADALTGRTDGRRVVTELARAGLLVPCSRSGRLSWYRYHDLLAESLRAELRLGSPERIVGLHRRAAAWHAEVGRPADALRHALGAREWGLAKRLLGVHWHQVIGGDQVAAQALAGPAPVHPAAEPAFAPARPAEPPAVEPPPAETLVADPQLALAWAADLLNRRDGEGAATCLRLASTGGHDEARDHGGRFEIIMAALRLAEAQLGGDTTVILRAAGRLLGLSAPQSGADEGVPAGVEDAGGSDGARAMALSALGAARLGTGDLRGAEEDLTRGLTAARQAGMPCLRVACAGRLALLRAMRGELGQAERTAEQALGIAAGDCRCSSHGAHAYLARAIVRYQRGRLEETRRHLELSARSSEATCDPLLPALIAIVGARVLQAQGDPAHGFEMLLEGRRRFGERRPSRFLEHWFAAAEADLRTSSGDTATARDLLERAEGTSATLAVALARTYLRDGDPSAAVRALPRWADDGVEPFLAPRLDAGLVEALAARRAGDVRRASALVERVLALAAPEGFRQVFAQGGRPVRDLLEEHLDSGTAFWPTVYELIGDQPPPEAAPPEPAVRRALTERELTVLRYLQSMLSNVEIASELCLSVNTVKTHVRNIYRKLDTDRRREAVLRARELQLL
jgi:LuxR family maltose regulon positive regulatory protein